MLEPPMDRTAQAAAGPAIAARDSVLGRGLDRSLGLLVALAFASQLLVAMMLPVIPLFAIELGASPVVLALMVSISAVASAGGQLFGGVLSDRAGARRLLPAGLAAYGVANLATATLTSIAPVVALRGLSGLGSGAYIVGERLYIRQVVDRVRLAFANGLVQAAGAAGLIIGPLLGGALAEATDLRTPFLVVGIISLIVAGVALFLPARRRADSADALAVGRPVSREGRGLSILLLANLAFAAGYGSFITTFTPFAEGNLEWTTTEIGLAFSLFGLGNIVVGPWIAGVADRRGRRWIGALATIPIVALAVALIAPTPTVLLYALVFAAGGGTAGFTASWNALLSIATAGPRGGRAFGTVAAGSSLGIVIGALAAGGLWDSIDILAGMLVTVIAFALAGIVLATYPEASRTGPLADDG